MRASANSVGQGACFGPADLHLVARPHALRNLEGDLAAVAGLGGVHRAPRLTHTPHGQAGAWQTRTPPVFVCRPQIAMPARRIREANRETRGFDRRVRPRPVGLPARAWNS